MGSEQTGRLESAAADAGVSPLRPKAQTQDQDRAQTHKAEEGYMLVAVMFVMAIMILWMAVAIPRLRKDLQRDREVETMQRGKQYIRAIKLYNKKIGGFPPTIKALENTNGIRFLRKKYADPTTGKADWKIVRYGQARAQSLGLFGQPIPASLGGGGIGPIGGNCGIPGLNGTANTLSGSSSGGSSFGGGSGSSFSGGSGSSFGSNSSQNGTSDCGTATGDGSGAPTDPNAPQNQLAQDQNSGQPGSSTDQAGQSGAGSGGNGSGSAFGSGSGSSFGSSNGQGSGQQGNNSGTGLTGQTFGGGGIIGVSPNSPKPSILVYKKKKKYNQWEFVYDPNLEKYLASLAGTGGAANCIPNASNPGIASCTPVNPTDTLPGPPHAPPPPQ